MNEIDHIKENWRNCVWAHTLSDAEGARMIPHIQFASLAAGQYIWRRGDPSDYWVGMARGSMKLCATSPQGKQVTFTGMAMAWIGEDGLVTGKPRACDAVVLLDAMVAKMPRVVFMELLRSNPEFNLFVMQQMSERVNQFMELIAFDRMLSPIDKVARSLAALFNAKLFPPRSLLLKITQNEVAEFCNMSRSRVNTALKRLETEGLILNGYNQITILDLSALQRYAEV